MELIVPVSPAMRGRALRYWLMQAALFLSILSQMPLLRIVAGIPTQLLIYPGWLLLIGVSVFQGVRIRQRFLLTTIVPSVVFVFFLIVYEILTGNKYFTSGLSFQFYMAFVLTWVGYANADVLVENFREMTRTFLVGATLLGVDIYWEFFRGYSLETIDYVFRSKNSAAFILLMGMLLAVVDWAKQSVIEKGIRMVLFAFFIYLCVVMRSRAVLLGVVIFAVYWGYSSPRSRGVKLLYTMALIGIVAFVWFYEPLNELIIQNILLNGQEATNLNEVSSNRLEYFEVVQSQMNELVFGIGEYYMDNFYLESILNNGWLLGSGLIVLAAMPLRMVKFGGHNTGFQRFLTVLVIVHLFNAAFEGYTPFGPGTKCMLLWLYYGAWQYQMERKGALLFES